MKITFLKSVVSQNGGSRVVAIYAEKLRALGHDVTVVSRYPEEHSVLRKGLSRLRGHKDHYADPNRTAYFNGLGDRHIQVPFGYPIDPRYIPDSDIVIATWWRTAFEVAVLPPEKGTKAYFVQHHEAHPHQPWDLAAGSYWLPLKKITIADWLVETMAGRYEDMDVPKVENSVDTDQFNAPPRARNTIPTVGLLYSRAPFKGVEISLKAIEITKEQFPDLKVVAFGHADPEGALSLPEGAEFHKLPEQDTLRDIYAKCDAWLFSSRSEGAGLPILEAMACRTPVVATRAGMAPDKIEHGETGYLSDIDDPEALAAGLIELLSLSPEDWRAMSDKVYTKVQSYTWDDAAARFEATLRKIADEADQKIQS